MYGRKNTSECCQRPSIAFTCCMVLFVRMVQAVQKKQQNICCHPLVRNSFRPILFYFPFFLVHFPILFSICLYIV